MALSQADLATAYKAGLHYGTINGAGVITELHQFFGSAVQAAGVANASVAILASDGTYTTRANTLVGTHDFGVPR